MYVPRDVEGHAGAPWIVRLSTGRVLVVFMGDWEALSGEPGNDWPRRASVYACVSESCFGDRVMVEGDGEPGGTPQPPLAFSGQTWKVTDNTVSAAQWPSVHVPPRVAAVHGDTDKVLLTYGALGLCAQNMLPATTSHYPPPRAATRYHDSPPPTTTHHPTRTGGRGGCRANRGKS